MNPNHAFRIPGTPHQRTGNPGYILDADLNPVQELKFAVASGTVTSPLVLKFLLRLGIDRAIEETVKVRKVLRKLPESKVMDMGMPRWVSTLMSVFGGARIKDCRKRLLHFIVSNCAADGMSLEDCRKIIELLNIEMSDRYWRMVEWLYPRWVRGGTYFEKLGGKRLSVKTLLGLSDPDWYTINPEECINNGDGT